MFNNTNTQGFYQVGDFITMTMVKTMPSSLMMR